MKVWAERLGMLIGAGIALTLISIFIYLAVPWASHVWEVAYDFWFGP